MHSGRITSITVVPVCLRILGVAVPLPTGNLAHQGRRARYFLTGLSLFRAVRPTSWRGCSGYSKGQVRDCGAWSQLNAREETRPGAGRSGWDGTSTKVVGFVNVPLEARMKWATVSGQREVQMPCTRWAQGVMPHMLHGQIGVVVPTYWSSSRSVARQVDN